MSAGRRLLIDAVLLVAFVAAYYPATTGLTLHEWLCVALVVPALLHLVVNWDWAVRVAGRLAGRLRSRTKVDFAVDTLLFVSAVTVVLSGLLVSRVVLSAVGLDAEPAFVWHRVHSVSADATIVLVLVHLGLHWRWIVRATRLNLMGRGRALTDGMAGHARATATARVTRRAGGGGR